MPRKKPTKTSSHSNNEIAYDNLKEVFPGPWNIGKAEADQRSNIEYGQDWRVGVVDDDEAVTGEEFRVQSKVAPIKDGFIQTQIKVTTLNYLYDLPSPVLLHFYDQVDETGYVMWLEHWYLDNRKAAWEEQETVLVKIPINQDHILDKKQTTRILKHLRQLQARSHVDKLISHNNLTNKDHRLSVIDLGSHLGIRVDTLNSRNPTTFEFPDASSQKHIRRFVETGKPADFVGTMRIRNLPPVLKAELPPGKFEVKMFPRTDLIENVPVRILFLNDQDEVVYKDSFVELKALEPGTKQTKWYGHPHKNKNIAYELFVDLDTKHAKIHINLNLNDTSPGHIRNCLRLVKTMPQAKHIQFVDPKTEQVWDKVPFQSNATPNVDNLDLSLRLAEALAYIHESTGTLISFPKEFEVTDLIYAETACNILKSGVCEELPKELYEKDHFLIIDIISKFAQEFLNEIDMHRANLDTTDVPIPYATDETNIKILDQKLDLGPSNYMLVEVKIQNRDEIERLLEQNPEKIKFVLGFNREKSYLQFSNWIKEEPQ